MMGYAPGTVVLSAGVLYDAVITSLFSRPVIVPVKVGLGSPYNRVAFATVTVSETGMMVRLPVTCTV
jgi:hypothetical protein